MSTGDSAHPALTPERQLARTIGPVYRLETVMEFTGLSRQDIEKRMGEGTLLGITTASQVLVFPTFGFDGREIAGWVPAVMAPMRRADIDTLTVSLWLTTPNPDIDDTPPVHWQRHGGSVEVIVGLAAIEAARSNS